MLRNNDGFKVGLISMPFAAANLPSIALTQLQSILRQNPGEPIESEIFYVNLDFAEYLGGQRYRQISDAVTATSSGLGEWLFRQAAFPELEDNFDEYLRRYGATLGLDRTMLKSHMAAHADIGDFLDELIDRYALEDYAVVGFSSMFAQNTASFAMAKMLKQRNPEIITVIGGANCETIMGAVIARNVEEIDFVFSGPALKTFPQLINCIREGQIEDCHDIRGVFSKTKCDRLIGEDCREIGEELGLEAELPLDYEGFLEAVEQKCPGLEASLLFETSRGCWWGERSHCTFCGLNGVTMKYRSMAPEQAVDQFNKMFEFYPRVSRFESVDNILPRQYFKSVFPNIKPPGSARIFYEIKADVKDHEMEVLANFFEDTNYDNAYIATTAKWLKPLGELIAHWTSQWQEHEGRPRLEFDLRDDKKIICDSRSGTMVEHDVGPSGLAVLAALDRPSSVKRLAKKLDDFSEPDLEREVESLREARLVFEEDQRYMSLVVDSDRERDYV